MVTINLTVPEKNIRDFLADFLPTLIKAKDTTGHELVIELEDTKNKMMKKNISGIYDGKKKITKKGTAIIIEGKYSKITLDKTDLNKIKKLL